MWLQLVSLVFATALAPVVTATGEPAITFDTSGFVLASPTGAVPLLLDSNDTAAVHIAAKTFVEDVYTVTGQRMQLYNDTLPPRVKQAVVVGTIASDLVRRTDTHRHASGVTKEQTVLGRNEGVTEGLEDKWEAFDVEVVSAPLPGLTEGLVVAGSDRVSHDHTRDCRTTLLPLNLAASFYASLRRPRCYRRADHSEEQFTPCTPSPSRSAFPLGRTSWMCPYPTTIPSPSPARRS